MKNEFVENAIKDRRSIRLFLPKNVPQDLVLRLIDAARWAPSAHNAQPWRFIVIFDPIVKRRLAEAMASDWLRDLERDGVPQEEAKRLAEESIKRFSEAPVLIIAAITMREMHKYPDRRRQRFEHLMATQSLAAAIQNLLLTAHAEGLGACWFCAPLFCQETVRRVLRIPRDVEPQALIALGYPAESPKAPPRKPIKEIAFKDYWGISL
ncbi:MAG: nitroreductase family protein [Candidatus Bathyarchaeia archaeon]|nr:nitroreductase family protein [Candidatus Bathyarchaeota archaeon]